MLEKIIQKNTEKSKISEQLKGLREQLTLLENKIKTAGMPVIITFDGWSAAGKGSMIAKLIRSLDPRFYKVVSFRAPNEQEKRMPWLWRYWQTLPKKGEFLILDRSWYRDTVNAFMYGEIDKETRDTRLEDICTFERQLTDDGYVIVKIFLHITEDEQKKRIEKLENSSVTSWRVESHDIKNMEKYDKFFRRYDKMLESTNTAFAPWTCIGANERASAELEVLTAVTKAVSTAVSAKEKGEHYIPEPQFDTCGYNYPEYKTIEMPALAEVDMNKSLDEAEYEKKLKKYQELEKLKKEPDVKVALLDVMLPGIDGFAICKQVRAEKDIPILMVTARGEDVDKIRGLGFGADDYIEKPFSPSVLVARVKAHLAQYARLKPCADTPKTITVGPLTADPAARRITKNGVEVPLKNKEYELLFFLMRHPEQVFSREDLYELIWGLESMGDNITVAVHINRLREKIEDTPADPKLLQTVWGVGYRLHIV